MIQYKVPPGLRVRYYTVPWGLRHVIKAAATFAAWAASGFKPLPYADGIEAWTPGPFTLLLTTTPSYSLLRHEMWHQMRCHRLGLFAYWSLMLRQYIRHGYANAPEEVAARKFAGGDE